MKSISRDSQSDTQMKCTYTFESDATPEAFVDPPRVGTRAESAINQVFGKMMGVEWEQRAELLEAEPQFTITFPTGADANALQCEFEEALRTNRVAIKSIVLS
jgi:hypothetical protein